MAPRSAGPGFAGAHWDRVFPWKYTRSREQDPLCASACQAAHLFRAPDARRALARGRGYWGCWPRRPPFYTVRGGRRVPISDRRLISQGRESLRGRRGDERQLKKRFAGSAGHVRCDQ
jgi:hypothetical protein